MRRALTTTSIALLAFCAGMTASFFTLPLWVTMAINVAKIGPRADWLGFLGSVLAGAMTLIGAVIAWFAVQRTIVAQRQLATEERDDLLVAINEELADIFHMINTVWRSVERALTPDPNEKIRNRRFGNAKETFRMIPPLPRIDRIWQSSEGLQPTVRQRLGSVLQCMRFLAHSASRIFEGADENMDRADWERQNFEYFCQNASYLLEALQAFDKSLANIFDGRVKIDTWQMPTSEKMKLMEAAVLADEAAIRKGDS